MAQAGFSFIAIILAAITGVIDNPPEDLLSLSDTKTVLTQLKVDQSEDNLISLLSSNTAPKADTSEFDKAVKQLREGNSKARRAAKAVLKAAGEEHKAYFQKLASDSDPEVSETAKNILKNFAAKKQAAKQMGMTDDVLKILAIRRLTELKSSKALEIVKALKASKNKDIVIEAERASALLQGNKAKRHSRNQATQKLLKMIPENIGFVAALDLTEPSKSPKLTDYLAPMKKVPGMDMAMITGMFHKSVPMLIQKVGNPQIDSIVFVSSEDLGIDSKSSWVGFIGMGKYNSQKMKDLLANEGMEAKKANGLDYWAERWGPSICPVNDEVIVLSFGDNNSNHMEKMLANIKGSKVPAAAKNSSTANSRLIASGKLSKKQKEMMKREIQNELNRLEGRNGRRGVQVEKALMELGLLCTSADSFVGKYADKVVIIKAEMDNEENAKKMVTAIDVADKEIRTALKEVPFPVFQAFNMEKRFSKAEANGKTVTLKVKGEMLEMMTMMPFMMFARMERQMNAIEAQEIDVVMEEIEEVEIEPPPAVEKVEDAPKEKK